MDRLLENRNIILTGSNRGIGKAMLAVFAENGANIWAFTRKTTDEFEKYCKELGDKEKVEIRPVGCELTDADDIKRAVKEIMSLKLPVDGLVNNAGIIYNALFPMSQMQEVRNQFEVNFFAPYLLTQYVIKLMLKNQRGSIVNLASMVGLDGKVGQSAYAGTKAAITGLTKTLSKEFGKSGIRVNAIAPGYIETDMLTSLPGDKLEEIKGQISLGKTGKPEDVAKVAVFLLSDLSSYITGEVIRTDGGI